jgi:hypothetical protein
MLFYTQKALTPKQGVWAFFTGKLKLEITGSN